MIPMSDPPAPPGSLRTRRGPLPLPAFLPDATLAVVKTLGTDDLLAVGVEALMVNAFHLSRAPGVDLIARLGGVHPFMGWSGPVASDSGGFQAYSLLAGKGAGKRAVKGGAGRDSGRVHLAGLSDEGFTLQSPARARRQILTPEKSIRQQLRLGADILFCLDQCTHPAAPPAVQRESVRRTVEWARRCRQALDAALDPPASNARRGVARGARAHAAAAEEAMAQAAVPEEARPLLFAVVQGGASPELRRECMEQLAAIGFDGYAFGGWPVDERGALEEMAGFMARLAPQGCVLHGLGIGKPETLVAAWREGYRLFDCVIPTRDGRHGRLYSFTEAPETSSLSGRGFYREQQISTGKFAREKRPVEEGCPCPLCRRYPAAYLHHLFQIQDPAGARLASLHNLTFYRRLIDVLRAKA